MEQTDIIMTIYIPRMYGIDYVLKGIFDNKIIKQCEKKIREMEKELNLHRKIFMQLQKQQKVCWLANNKVAEYQNCLNTSKKIYDHMAGKLSKSGESVKQRSMNKIQNHLQGKLKQVKRAEKKYKTLLELESKTRLFIKKLEQDTLNLIKFQVNDKTLTPTAVNRRIHTTISIQTLVQKMSSRYQFTLPQEFTEKNGFHTKLPDVEFVKREFLR